MTAKPIVRIALSRILASLLLFFVVTVSYAQQQSDDTEQLGMALEYFQSGKYHESLLIFQRLDKKYKLNPRFRAYIGLCYYYEWDYKKAVTYFDKELPKLGGLSPHELSVYYYSAAESYFQMQRYDKALPYFEQDLKLCYDKEKGDVCYRIGLCYMFQKEWQKAYDYYTKAEDYYRQFRDVNDLEARLAQIATMKNGCKKGIAIIIDHERSELLQTAPQINPNGGSEADDYESPWSGFTTEFGWSHSR